MPPRDPATTRGPYDTIELELPPQPDWYPVVRLVLGGIAERNGLSYEELDDLQLAVERLLAEAGAQERVRISVEVSEQSVRTSIGPLRERAFAEALRGPEPEPGDLTLRRILDTVVDSFGVEDVADGELIVRLEKRVKPH